MRSLYWSFGVKTDTCHIIRIPGHAQSCALAQRCADSVTAVGMRPEFWDAYDGTGAEIIPPAHHGQFMSMIKLTDHYMTRSEVACALSHISLWVQCVEQDRCMVILEHDAVMMARHPEHTLFNSLGFLGSAEQVKQQWQMRATPPHGTDGHNRHFICRAHAYSIDPVVGKNLLSQVLKYGISAPLDVMLRADIVPMHQMAQYAYDEQGPTTIKNRVKSGRASMRNENLEI